MSAIASLLWIVGSVLLLSATTSGTQHSAFTFLGGVICFGLSYLIRMNNLDQ